MKIADDARGWFVARARAASLERQLARDRTDRSDPIGLAFDFFALVEALHGWPLPPDHVTERENEYVRTTWAMIRRNWARRPNANADRLRHG
jgi:hypothetical protein